MIIKKTLFTLAALTCMLTGCNTNPINPANPPITPTYDAQHDLIVVYQKRANLPRGTKIIDHVTALNKLPNGQKASPESVMIELKRQARLAGGIGIVNIISGTAQTTADVVALY